MAKFVRDGIVKRSNISCRCAEAGEDLAGWGVD